jgi:hypothetical protein
MPSLRMLMDMRFKLPAGGRPVAIAGAVGTGKTVLLTHLLGDLDADTPLVVVDPKGDSLLERAASNAGGRYLGGTGQFDFAEATSALSEIVGGSGLVMVDELGSLIAAAPRDLSPGQAEFAHLVDILLRDARPGGPRTLIASQQLPAEFLSLCPTRVLMGRSSLSQQQALFGRQIGDPTVHYARGYGYLSHNGSLPIRFDPTSP